MLLEGYKYYDEAISLGRYCQLPWYMRNFGLWSGRDFIFDDLASDDLSTVCELIEKRFQSFFLFNNLKTIEYNKFNTFTIKDEINKIYSVHNFNDELDKSTYKRFIEEKKIQIKNLFDMIENSYSLLFIRVNKNEEKIENTVRLLELLKKIRKNKKFDLYVFQESNVFKKVSGMENLFMFYDKNWKWNKEIKWHGDLKLWNMIFKNIRIKKNYEIRNHKSI